MEIKNEKNGTLENKREWKKTPTTMTSVCIDVDLYDELKNLKISLKDAVEFGIKFLIAERDGYDYPANKISEKLEKTIKMLSAKSQECEAIRDQMDNLENERDESDDGSDEDIDNILNAKPQEK